ncbi:MAG: ABC transporter substrate-binding protein [Peptoniphilaceae bacterium]|nr:ABC transporter substrate-binding protein [Peptoniphilaceae bacterium]MDY3075704.1 ABC transporter substrate-binding protein [Peptoniphilaceae bacterium]MDY5842648.1 ABC transporter substrate-binding protein [Peptoniphilaceae bacterium]
MKVKRIIALFLVCVFCLTACGQKSMEGGKGTSSAAENAASSREMATSSETQGRTAKASQDFSMGVLFSPQDTLDPASVTSPGGMVLLYAVYDSLATINDEGITLRMAKSVEPNQDFTTYTITLKDDVKYSDGSPVTGQDVLLSLKHLAASPMYQSIFGNMDSDRSSADGQKITLVLKQPASDFFVSTIGMFSPVAKGGEFNGLGAGAYVVEKGDPQSGYVLKANERYYAGKPAIPRVTLKNVPDSASKVKALQTGEIDYAWGLDASAIQVLKQEKDIELPHGSLDGASALELVLNTRVEPFQDPEIRKAAKLTLDREKMVRTLLGDYGAVGNDMLGKGFSTYPVDIEQTKADKEEAKKIFAEKGVKEFTIVSSDVLPGLNKATEMMVQEFQEVGVTVHVEQLDPQTFYSQMGDLYQKSAFTFYWVNRTPLAEFRSQVLKDSHYNVSGYSSEETEKNFALATSTQEPQAQTEAIHAICREIHDFGGELIWGYQMDISAKRKGFEAPMTQSVPWLGEATFTPERH